MPGTRSIGFGLPASHGEGGMHIAEQGRQILIGNVEAYEALALSHVQWRTLFLLATTGLPAAAILYFDPSALKAPITLVVILLVLNCVAVVLIVIRSVFKLTASANELELVVFDLDQLNIEVLIEGPFGLTRELVAFSDVQRIRLGRGDWDGATVKSLMILDCGHGRSFAVGADLSSKDLTVLRVMTGIRAA